MCKQNINVHRGVVDISMSLDLANSIKMFTVDSSNRYEQINLIETKETSSEMKSSMLHTFHVVDGRHLKTVIPKTV